LGNSHVISGNWWWYKNKKFSITVDGNEFLGSTMTYGIDRKTQYFTSKITLYM